MNSCLKLMMKRLAGCLNQVLMLALLMCPASVFAGNRQFLHRDKNGTSGGAQKKDGSQTPYFQVVASHRSLDAERGGFEPPVPFPGHSISSAAQSATLPPLRLSCTRNEATQIF